MLYVYSQKASLVGFETANAAEKPQISTATTDMNPTTCDEVIVEVMILMSAPVSGKGCSSWRRLKALAKTPTAPTCCTTKGRRRKCPAAAM